MSSPADKKNDFLGLTQKDAKLLLLGIACTSESDKVDFAKLAHKMGYTANSARVLHGNARRKLQRLHGGDETEDRKEIDTSAKATVTPKKSQSGTSTESKKDAPATE
ncbi:hypothetical protein NUU61_005397 [Penicillium alfredii]|uniref:Uncharacterized protein n=1 Tax=Penicillium alfredii TaxID=1506179 RepID=A0A9W9F9H8_9EURO|nr:uncharacterized protein NUU61_005397 [Penicillium alfredii]KAJ5096041.1 hypothetical protein NUU61_005397 [Penicillium alfredii]